MNIQHPYSEFNGILTVSIGVSSIDTKLDKLFEHADTALYEAKENGRNRYEVYANE